MEKDGDMIHLSGRSLLEVIEDNSQQWPDAIALMAGSDHCSYRQLLTRVDCLAMQLQAAGVHPGAVVGVLCERSMAGVIALLALFRLRALYVPLNPQLPDSMLSQQIQAVAIAWVIAANEDHARIDRLQVDGLVVIDPQAGQPPLAGNQERQSSAQLNSGITMGDSAGAYIIFTSGSTGLPKPVLVSMRALAQHARATIWQYQLTRDDRVLHICSPRFDVSLEEIIPTLLSGACLVIAPALEQLSEDGLQGLLSSRAVTIVNLPTSLWCSWVDTLLETRATPPPLLSRVIIGSEACPPVKLRQWQQLASESITCINAYGLSETTITNCAWQFPVNSLAGQEDNVVIPIGQPLPGNHCYLLDDGLQTCPEQADGEIFIGGQQLSEGYPGNPALTAQRFLPDPYAGQSGQRMYRTGDRGRYNLVGDLCVLGRADRQLKLRGHRIEPAEIELVAGRLPLVRQVAVKLETRGRQQFLVAYVQFAETTSEKPGVFIPADQDERLHHISDYLSQQLPDYACPSFYCMVEAFPLNENAKIDYSQLSGHWDCVDTQPAQETDNALSMCVQTVLGFLPGDLHQNFFALGGDSISATRLAAQLRQQGYACRLRELVAAPSLQQWFEGLQRTQEKAEANKPAFITAVKLSKKELLQLHANQQLWRRLEFICGVSPLQISMLQHSMQMPGSGNYIEQVEGRLTALQPELFKQAWLKTAARHEMLRTYFCFRLHHKILQICNKQAEPLWLEEDWRHLDEAKLPVQIKNKLAADRKQGFALLNQPPQRLQLLRLGERDYHFIWTYHHALLDGWSDILVLDEVFTHYRALCEQSEPILSPAPGYRPYIEWLAAQDHAAAESYWSAYLHSLSPTREWLLARDFGIAMSERIINLEHRFSPAVSAALSRRAQRSGVTLNNLVVAAMALAIGAIRQTREVIVGTIAAVRPAEVADIEHIAALCLNLVPARIRWQRQQPVDALLTSLLNDQLEREQHAFIGADRIHQASALAADAMLYDCVIIFENYPAAVNDEVNRMRSHAQSSFPLNLYVWPGERLHIELKANLACLEQGVINEVFDSLVNHLEELPVADSVDQCAEGSSPAAASGNSRSGY